MFSFVWKNQIGKSARECLNFSNDRYRMELDTETAAYRRVSGQKHDRSCGYAAQEYCGLQLFRRRTSHVLALYVDDNDRLMLQIDASKIPVDMNLRTEWTTHRRYWWPVCHFLIYQSNRLVFDCMHWRRDRFSKGWPQDHFFLYLHRRITDIGLRKSATYIWTCRKQGRPIDLKVVEELEMGDAQV